MMRRLITVFIVGLLIAIMFSVGLTAYMHPVFCKENPIKVEYKEHFNPKQYISYVFLGNVQDVSVEGAVDTNHLGDYEIAYVYRGHKKVVPVEVVDREAPKLRVKKVTVDEVADVKAEDFVEVVSDNDSAKVSIKNSDDEKKVGQYKVTISAMDPSGNETTADATLVRVADIKPPTLTVGNTLQVTVGTKPDLMNGVTAKDESDPKPVITVDDKALNIHQIGTYQVTYQAKDRSGNVAESKRSVVVAEQVTPPKNQMDGSKVIYLTFDDGPSANTGKILDILKKYQVKATFFVTGLNQAYNSNIVRAHQEGHVVGLHTYTHNYDQVYRSETAYFDDLQKISDMVYQLTGVRSKLVRFPGGSSNTVSRRANQGIMSRLVRELPKRGYQYFDWNCSSMDASGNTMPTNVIVNSSINCRYPQIILLFHDSQPKVTTVQALPAIIEHYKKAGYAFKSLTYDSYAAHHHVSN